MILRHTPIKRRTRIKVHSPKRRPSLVNEDFKRWLRETWPCFVCFKLHCEAHSIDFNLACRERDARMMFLNMKSLFDCGFTQAAHVGRKGIGQRCSDLEAMPLGLKHHLHPTMGGFSDSHHAGTREFWKTHNLKKEDVFALLHELYERETGKVLI